MKKITRGFALLLSTALLHVSFGLEAWAQIVPVSGLKVPLGGQAAATSSINWSLGLQNGSAAFSLSLTPADLTRPLSFPGLGPSVQAITVVSGAAVIETVSARPTAADSAVSAAEETSAEKPTSETNATAPAKTNFATRVAELKRFFTNHATESTPTGSADAVLVPGTRRSAEYSALRPSGLAPVSAARGGLPSRLRVPYLKAAESRGVTAGLGALMALGATVALGGLPFASAKVTLELAQAGLVLLTGSAIFVPAFLFWRRKMLDMLDYGSYHGQDKSRLRKFEHFLLATRATLAVLFPAQLALLALSPDVLSGILFLYLLGEAAHYHLYKIANSPSHAASRGGIYGHELQRLKALDARR
jgi:hypothetical protein